MFTECDIPPRIEARDRIRPGGWLSSPYSVTCHFLQEKGVRDGSWRFSVLIQQPPHHTQTHPLPTQASAGRLRHRVLSPILLGMAETTAVVQLRNPAQPPRSRAALCQRQEAGRNCARLLDTGKGWTPGAGARPGLGVRCVHRTIRESCAGLLSPFVAWRALGGGAD